jgi:hypothetical protein
MKNGSGKTRAVLMSGFWGGTSFSPASTWRQPTLRGFISPILVE